MTNRTCLLLGLVLSALSPCAVAGKADLHPPVPSLPQHVQTARTLAKMTNGEVLSVTDTGSMSPVLSARDLLILEKVPFDHLREGDVVVFHRRAHYSRGQFLEKGWVGHRIVEIRNGYVVTKGDHPNAQVDDDNPGASRIRGRVVYVVNGQTGEIRDMRLEPSGERVSPEDALSIKPSVETASTG